MDITLVYIYIYINIIIMYNRFQRLQRPNYTLDVSNDKREKKKKTKLIQEKSPQIYLQLNEISSRSYIPQWDFLH